MEKSSKITRWLPVTVSLLVVAGLTGIAFWGLQREKSQVEEGAKAALQMERLQQLRASVEDLRVQLSLQQEQLAAQKAAQAKFEKELSLQHEILCKSKLKTEKMCPLNQQPGGAARSDDSTTNLQSVVNSRSTHRSK